MIRATLIFIAFMVALSAAPADSGNPRTGKSQDKTGDKPATQPDADIKVAIASVGSSLGPPTNRYKVGDQIPITITMTNTTASASHVCISSDLYQNVPTLTRNGELVPYMKWQTYERQNAQRNNTCKEENLPEPVLLRPNEPKLADWFLLVDSTGADAWYDPLPAGKYELSIQRRLSCCDGPMVQSNKISFEVIP